MIYFDTITFTDIFKKSILKLMPEAIDPLVLFLTVGIAFLVGLGIFFVYRRNFLGVVYDHSFNISLVIMTMLTAVIIVTISTNITLSLGMVGALSIVRYRTAVKNHLDLMFMFWAIASGIAIGAQFYYIAVITLFLVALALSALRRIRNDDHLYLLIINYEADSDVEESILRSLQKHKPKLRSKIVKNSVCELTLEVFLKTENMNLTSDISTLKGVKDVTLVQYRGSYEI